MIILNLPSFFGLYLYFHIIRFKSYKIHVPGFPENLTSSSFNTTDNKHNNAYSPPFSQFL